MKKNIALTSGIKEISKGYTPKDKERLCKRIFEISKQMSKDDRDKVILTVHQALDSVYVEGAEKQKAKCRKGCSYCCEINCAISKDEANVIKRYIEAANIKPISYPIERVNFPSKCPFLSSSKSCMIYEVRPASCRKYYVLSDPEYCNTRNPKNDNRAVVTLSNLEMEMLVSAMWNLSEIMDIRDAFTPKSIFIN